VVSRTETVVVQTVGGVWPFEADTTIWCSPSPNSAARLKFVGVKVVPAGSWFVWYGTSSMFQMTVNGLALESDTVACRVAAALGIHSNTTCGEQTIVGGGGGTEVPRTMLSTATWISGLSIAAPWTGCIPIRTANTSPCDAEKTPITGAWS